MDTKPSTDWTVGRLIELWGNNILRVNDEYQRGEAWNKTQERMFIDSILRGYPIPAFYFHKKQVSSGEFGRTDLEIVDGQQRINAIYRFSNDEFSLLDPSDDSGFKFPNFFKGEECPWGGKRFGELSEELQNQLKNHEVIVYEITAEDENPIRDLFIRLQGGTPLTPQDKRDSWPGNFTEFVLKAGGKKKVSKWYGWPFFREIAKPKKESDKRQLAAQTFMLFWTVKEEKRFCDIKSSNIDDFYHAHVDFDGQSEEAKRFEKICNVLHNAMRDKPSIAGHYVIHLILLADSLLEEYVSGWDIYLADKLFEFEKRNSAAREAVKNGLETDYEHYFAEYGQWTQTRSDGADTIRRRHAFFAKEMLELLAPVKKAAKRSFSDLERQTVFFRDRELCQWCRMQGGSHKLAWNECEIHHVERYAEGGPTDFDNAALVHRDCHPKAKEKEGAFREWWSQTGRVMPETKTRRSSTKRDLPPDNTKAEFSYEGQTYSGEIREGSFILKGPHEGVSCKSFSAASKTITGTSRNGWKDWSLKLPGEDSWILADEWRRED